MATWNLFGISDEFAKRISDLASTKGLLTVNEYTCIAKEVEKASCNMLIFGLGSRNNLWRDLNPNGLTVYLDESSETIRKTKKWQPKVQAFHVKYDTQLKDWGKLLKNPNELLLDLPAIVDQTNWDIIFVNEPSNTSPLSTGRMKSIYTASYLAGKSKGCSVFVNDCHLIVESTYCDKFLQHMNLHNTVDTLRHYIINAPNDVVDTPHVTINTPHELTQSQPIKIAILSRLNGEKEMVSRLKVAATNIGWNAEENSIYHETEAKFSEGVDFIINLAPGQIPPSQGINNYAVFSRPSFLDDKGYLKEKYLGFEGFLFTWQNLDPIIQQFKELNIPLHYINWYPTINLTNYKKIKPKKLIHVISRWKNDLSDKRFKDLYTLLDQTTNCLFYSVDENHKTIYPNSYSGKITCEGPSLINTLSNGGITLIIHSDFDNQAGIPCGKIFEAAAASCVIISDSNPFVLKHFGDSVLYFDQTKDPDAMFDQINDHMNWVFSHPKEALEIAKKAHDIFVKYFTLENQLLKLQQLNDTISKTPEK